MKLFNSKLIIFILILSFIYVHITVNSVYELTGSSEIINAYKNYNLIRLHLVADSNSPEDQYIKRKLRDRVNTELKDKSEISYNDQKDLKQIQTIVNDYLKEKGVNYQGEVSFGEQYFPQRTYGEITLPAGNYKAVKIKLGKAEGSNWWCVLFPPLCISTEDQIEKEDDGNLKQEKSDKYSLNNTQISNEREKFEEQIEFRFKIAEYINLERINNNIEYLRVKLNNFNLKNLKSSFKPEIND